MSNQIKIINGHKVNVSSNSDNVQLNLTIKDKGISRNTPFNKQKEFEKIKEQRRKKEEEQRKIKQKQKDKSKMNSNMTPREMGAMILKMSADIGTFKDQKSKDFMKQKILDFSKEFRKKFGWNPTKENFEKKMKEQMSIEMNHTKKLHQQALKKYGNR